MRTTLVIDDDLHRRVKAKAALEGRTVTDLVEEAMRLVHGRKTPTPAGGRRVRLPLVRRGVSKAPSRQVTKKGGGPRPQRGGSCVDMN